MSTFTEDIDAVTAGYLAALKSNSDEIARLAEALRQAEKSRTDDYREHCEAVRLVMAQRDAARAEIEKGHADRIADNRVLLSQLDDARQDAERLAKALYTIAWEPIGESEASYATVYEDILVIAKDVLAAHAAATGKQVTK